MTTTTCHQVTELPSDFCEPVAIGSIPFLADLRDLILQINHAREKPRVPRWHFRYAPDFVVEMRPALINPNLFEGRALQLPNIVREFFERKAACPRGAAWLRYTIRALSPQQWVLCLRGSTFPYDTPGQEKAWLRLRLLSALTVHVIPGHALALLEDRCLNCAKVLTDPVSQARQVGSECAYHFHSWSGKYARPPMIVVPPATTEVTA